MLENPQGFNSYSFGLNNPIRFTDPSGQIAFDINDMNLFSIGQVAAPDIQQSSMCSIKTNSNETWNNNSDYLGMIFNPLK